MRYFVRPRRMTVVGRPVMYHGFRITVLNNHFYSFKYEWKVEAVSQTAKALLLRNYKRDKSLVMFDPTSSMNARNARERGFMKVNEMIAPFWWKHPYPTLESLT